MVGTPSIIVATILSPSQKVEVLFSSGYCLGQDRIASERPAIKKPQLIIEKKFTFLNRSNSKKVGIPKIVTWPKANKNTKSVAGAENGANNRAGAKTAHRNAIET